MQMGIPAAASVVPLMRYRDCAAAIEWLTRAFGFERQFVVGADDGRVAFAQLTCGTGMIMLGPVGETDLDGHLKQPDELGGAATQSCYVAVDNIETHYAHARDNGAEIVLDLEGGAFGSRGYSCRDPEGHIWNFGSYDPWRGRRMPETPPVVTAAKPHRRGYRRGMAMLGLSLAALAITLSSLGRDRMEWDGLTRALAPVTALLSAGSKGTPGRMPSAEAALAETRLHLEQAETARTAAENAAAAARLELDQERAARKRAEDGASAAIENATAAQRNELLEERSSREQAVLAAKSAEAALDQERAAKDTAVREADDLKSRLAAETRAREEAETAARRARGQLSRIEDAPKPDGAAHVMTGATTESGAPAGTTPTPVTQQAAGTASAKVPAETRPVTSRPRYQARVKAWEREIKEAPPKRKQDKRILSEPKKQANAARPAKPKPPKPAKKPDGAPLQIF